MKRKTITVICIILLAAILLGLLGFFGMRNNFLGIRNIFGYKKVSVLVASSDAPTEASTHDYFTKASSLQQILDENPDDFEFVIDQENKFSWKNEEKNGGTNIFEIVILYEEEGMKKQKPASETVLTDELTDECNYLIKLYSSGKNVFIGG